MKTTKSLKSLVGLGSSGVLALASCCSPSVPDRPDEVCKNMAVGELVVTEFMADPTGIDTGKQYIEIYNPTDHTLDLGGLQLFQSLADGSRLNAIALHGALITPHASFVLGDTGDDAEVRPAYVNYGYGSSIGELRHDSGRLGLRCGATVITEAKYTQVTAGHSRQLDGAMLANATLSSDEADWCDATEPLSGLAPEGENFGSPGTANSACPKSPASWEAGASPNQPNGTGGSGAVGVDAGVAAQQCFDSITGKRRPLNRPLLGDLVVSEIMPAPSVGNNGPGEWFEVLSYRQVDLNGLELANEGTGSTALASDTCLNVNAGDWLLFARGSDTTQNGGLPSPIATFDFTLADSGSSTFAERAVVLRMDGSELDRAVWTKSTKGAAWQRSASNLGSVAMLSSGDIWCVANAEHPYGAGDRGTPGTANSSCPNDITDGGSAASNALVDTGSGGAPTANSRVMGTGGSAATGGTLALADIQTTVPTGSGGVAAGGAPASVSTEETNPSDSGSDASGGAPSSVGTSSNYQCHDATGTLRDPVAPQAGDLVVTEVMSAPSQNNNGAGEWFEVLVNTAIDLNHLELANEGTGSLLLETDSCLSVSPGDRLVFARSQVFADNGGLPYVTAIFDFTVADSGSTAHPERAIALRFAGIELARAAWTKSTKGASWQLSESALDADAGGTPVDAGSDLDQWCVTPTGITFGLGDRGTPGTENVECS